MKKTVSLILALVLCMALSVPSFAAEPQDVTLSYGGAKLTLTNVVGQTTKTVDDTEYGGEGYEITVYLIPASGSKLLIENNDPDVYFQDGGYYSRDGATFWDTQGGGSLDTSKAEQDAAAALAAGKADAFRDDGDEYYYIMPVSLYHVVSKGGEMIGNIMTVGETELVGSICFMLDSGSGQPVTDTPAPTTPAAKPNVVPSPQKLSVNGKSVATEMYNIDNTNYFKLRDLAAMLDGTANQFNVDFDAARNVIVVTTGAPYTTANGYELQTGTDSSATAQASAQSLEIDGEAVTDLSVYNIGNTNFFGLRSLESYLGYEVGYDGASNTATITSK